MKSTLITVITFFILSSLCAQPSYFIKTYGGANEDYFTDVETTPNGGYIMVGASKSYGPDPNSFDGYIVITDSLGNKLKGLGYNGGGEEEAMFIRRAPDSTYYVCFFSDNGINNYKSHLLHLNDTLGWMWESYVFSSVNNKFFDGCFLPDGTFVVSAFINDSISKAIWFNNNGDTIKTKTLKISDSIQFRKISLINNQLVFSGKMLLKGVIYTTLDTASNFVSSYQYPTNLNNPRSVINTNGIIYITNTMSGILHCIAYDTVNKIQLWDNIFPTIDYAKHAYDLSLFSDDLLIAGYAIHYIDTTFAYLVKINGQTGEVIWERFYAPDYSLSSFLKSLKVINNQIFGVGKHSTNNGNGYDAFLLKADENGWASINDYTIETGLVGVYPNPAQEILHIVLPEKGIFCYRIYDTFGRLIFSGTTDDNQIRVDGLSVGLYVLSLSQNGITWHTKFIKE